MIEDFNVAPYFDDFDENQKYYRILFKPSNAVQARELTQLQTILQNQIEKFGRHIFQEGTIIYGGQFDIEDSVDYVRVGIQNPQLFPDNIIGEEVTGSTTGLRAYVTHAIEDEDDFGTGILYIRYKNSSNVSNTFIEEETLTTPDISFTVTTADHVGKGSLFTISEGISFTKGYFVKFDRQKTVLERFGTNPTKRVYFRSRFTTVNSDEEPELLDNSQGFPNFSAPGADRLRAELTLATSEIDEDLPEENHNILFEIENGNVRERKERTEYNKIYEELAKRTHDESGDYVVRGFGTYTREHLDTGNNSGRFELEDGGDENLLSLGIEPGLAYVKGYEINTESTKYIDFEKSTEYVDIDNEISIVRSGNYTELTEVAGIIDPDRATLIDLYDTAEERLSSAIESSAAASGSKIGEARVNSILHESGILGSPDAKIRLYVYDINMDSGRNFAEVRAVGNSNFFADIVLNSDGNAVLRDAIPQNRLHYVGSDHVRRLRDEDGTVDTSLTFYRSQDVNISSSGEMNVSVTTSNETLPYSEGILQSLQKRTMFISIQENVEISLSGTVSGSSGSTSLTGSGTIFTNLNVGDKLLIDNNTYTIASIASDTSIELENELLSGVSGAAFSKNYLTGDLIDLTSIGSDSGEEREVSRSGTSLLFDLKETFPSTVSCKIVFQVARNSAREIKKVLRPNRFVKIDCSSLADLERIYTGFSDVYKIRQVRKHNEEITDIEDGQDVTEDFSLHTGQTETSYGTSFVRSRTPLTTEDHLLIELDYFNPDFTSGVGYFSVDSYPIDDTVESDTTIQTLDLPKFRSSSGVEYDLRNYIDTRTIKQNTANDATTIANATTNPAKSTTVHVNPNGLRNPIPGTQITFDYSFYLARRDILVVDKEGKFRVVKGSPSVNPVYPTFSDNYMGVANIFVPPFPSISSSLGRIINRVKDSVKTKKITFTRYTMRDIGALKKRIETLEYYNALSLLEKNAFDLVIPDENGLDRFKNGVFVDGFLDHSLGATWDDDYDIAIDRKEKSLRPKFSMDSYETDFDTIESTGSINGDLVTVSYDEVPLIEQPNVTTFRNIEQSVFRYIGNMYIDPPFDTWVDDTVVDKNIEFDNEIDISDMMSTEWESWEKHGSGFSVYNRDFGDRSGDTSKAEYVGTFDTQSEAQAAGRDADRRFFIVNNQEERRTGIKTNVNVEKQTEELGNFVTDVSIIPYIRPQEIRIFCRGLKANTRFFVFFEDEDMNEFVTPIEIASSGDIEDESGIQNEGDELRTDETGELLCYLRIPEGGKQFRVGTKDVVVTDSPTNAEDATSIATGKFVAKGIQQQRQNTILSTQNIVETQEEVNETRNRGKQSVDIYGPSCMAYSFLVDVPEENEGIFLSSVDVYVSEMDDNLGMWFEIREMNSAGGITRKQVPMSEVWMKRDDPRIKITSDASEPTKVNFDSPIFLYNDTQYAFVIHTEGLNPNTYFWVSRLGEEDINTGEPVTGRQLTGTTFTTNNNLNWDIVPDVDLTVRFNRADFDTSSTKTATFTNKNFEYFDLPSSIPSQFFYAGESVEGSEKLTLNVSSGDSIVVGDKISGDSSGAEAHVVSISGATYRMDGFGFESEEEVTVYDSGGTAKNTVASVQSIKQGKARVLKVDRKNRRLILKKSNGEFFEGAVIRSTIDDRHDVQFEIVEFASYAYSALQIRPEFIDYPSSTISFEYTGYTDQMETPMSIDPHKTNEFDRLRRILSYSVEKNEYGGQKSFKVHSTFGTSNSYLSPVIDNILLNGIFIKNVVNEDIEGEDEEEGGNLENRYISKIVSLADDQQGEDLQVYLKQYNPPGTEVDVWVKIKNRYDVENIEDKKWIRLNSEQSRKSSVSDKQDYVDTLYGLPPSMMTGQFGEVQYTNDGNTFTGFDQFMVKIGLLAETETVYPKAAELRAIALQV